MSDIVERARDMHALAADSCDPEYNRILLEMANEIERLRAALMWALPLAEIEMENHRQRRLQAGYNFGTKRLGLYDDEVDTIEKHRRALEGK